MNTKLLDKLFRIAGDVFMLVLFATLFGAYVGGFPGAVALFIAGLIISIFMVASNLESGYYDYD